MNTLPNLSNLEANLTDLVAGAAPWLAPIPTAYLVGRATTQALGWPAPVAWCAAAIVESLGLAASNTALTLWAYNQGRRKTDPAAWAQFYLAAGLVFVYVGVAILLTVALDVLPALVTWAPAIFPALSLTGVMTLALRADHRRRLAAIDAERQAQRAARAAARATRRADPAPQPSQPATRQARQAASISPRRQALLDQLLAAYQANPGLGASEAARSLGVHRNSIYNYTDELVTAGRLSKNGHGWEVIP